MKVEIALPEERHIQELLGDLLPADRVEVAAMGFDPEWAIRNSIETSIESYVVLGDGHVGSILGVIEPDLVSDARPWMLSTNRILNRPKEVLRLSKVFHNQWLDRYGYLTNHVDQRHTRAVHWLRWLGARFTPEPSFGPYGRPFFLFEMGDPSCA